MNTPSFHSALSYQNDDTGIWLPAQQPTTRFKRPSAHSNALSILKDLRTVILSHLNECRNLTCQFWQNPIPMLLNRALFAHFIWILYALMLCGLSPDICQKSWILAVPLRALLEKDLRLVLFEYLWCYMCFAHLYQAIFYGLTWTLRDTSILTKAIVPPTASQLHKTWVFVSNFVDVALDLVLRPLLLFYVSLKLGQMQGFISSEAESSVYAGLFLHGLQSLFGTMEHVVYNKTGKRINFGLFFLAGITLIILNRTGVTDNLDTSIQQAWEAAQHFDALGRSAEKIHARNVALLISIEEQYLAEHGYPSDV